MSMSLPRTSEKKKMEKAVDAEGRFNTASSGMAPQGIGTAGATRGFVALESRMSILKKIAEALSNPSINMIGVYGPDGVGKTTLVKEVVRLAKEDNLFDAVVMVTVKQNPDTKTMIQREIAGMLGLKFDNKENVTIREDLRNRIMKEKKIIVILDDFCESLDLEDLGVPSGDSHKGCKILLTSKSPDVLCNQMDGKTNFLLEVSPLPETEALESKMLFSKKIVEALEDRNINMIGLYGGDDVGKTTLVKEVVRQAEEDNLFDAVVMVTVKQKQDLRRIQEEIADKLGLKLDSSEPANKKADFLLNRVKKEKKILIILDDFCESLDVEDLGLPSQGTHKGCKILLTSKSPDVLFNQMHSKTNFLLQVSPLREMEALELLKKTAEIGDPIEDSDLQSTAVEIARVCLGLPIALVVVGRALKKRSSVEWKKASEQLRKSVPRDTTKLQTAAHSTIKFSYIQLQSPEIQQLFLICGLMDSSIAYQDLLKRGMGLGIFQVTNTIQEARSKEYSFISKLKDSSLLLDSESGEHVIMHNVVRYASTLIASEDHNVLNMDQDIALTKWLNKDTLNICTAISLPSRHTRELPEWLGHPQRRLSYMSIKNQSEKMPDTFFDEMRGLKVFSVSEMHFSSLPASLHLLTNLRTLLMEQCVLGDLTMIGELKNLEILSLLNSKVKELPREIQQLTRLQLLDLNDCHELQVIPAGVLSSLLQLEELYMNSFKQWNVEGINGETSNVCLAELNHLSHLTTLHVHIPNTKVLPDDLLFARLNNYKICIGDAWSWLDEHESSRTLKLKLDIQLKNVVKILLKEVEALYIDELKGIKTDVCELDRDGFPLLKHLHVQNNVEILYIIDVVQLVSSVAFPILVSLYLDNLINLEEICYGQLPAGSFRNMRVLNVHCCNKLKFVFRPFVARGLLQLQEMVISKCSIMGAIVVERSEDYTEDNDGMKDIIELQQLCSLTLKDLPKLRSFYSQGKTRPSTSSSAMPTNIEPLFNQKVSFLGFQYLSSLQVNKCYNLRSLFSLSVARGLRHLQMLRITSCKMMDEIVVVGNLEEVATKERMAEETTAEGATKEGKAMLEIAAVGESAEAASKEKKTKKEIEITFPQLKTLDFEDLPNLKWFCFSTCAFGCPSLQEVRVENCPQMSQFSGGELKTPMLKYMQAGDYVRLGARDLNSAIKDLYKLKGPLSVVEHMRLKGPDKLRKILNNKFHDQSFSELISLHALSCDEQLNVFLSNLHPLSQKLQELKIDKCHSLRHLVATSAIRDTRDDTYDVCVTKVSFVKMQKLHLISLDKFEGISHAGLLAAESFSELRELKVDNCCSLVHFMQFKSLPELKSLEKLSIQRCDSLEEVFHLEDSQIEGLHRVSSKFTQLSKLVLSNLPKLKHIFNRDFANILNSQNSHVVNVKDSGLLSNHFSTSTNKSLKQITQEKNMEALHEKQKDGKTIAKIFFPHLNSIVFENLTSLQTFSSGDISFNFPSLVTLKMRNCPKINTFSIGISRINELQDIKSPLFTEKWSSKPFKELHLEHLDQFEKIWHDKLPVRELRILIVDTCNKLLSIIPSNSLIRLQELQKLTVTKCDCLEVIFDLKEQVFGELLPKLKEMVVTYLPRMKNLWTVEPAGITIFLNLRSLQVIHCNGLRQLFSASTARNLKHLEVLKLYGCEDMEVVISDEEESTESIIFSKLKCLILKHLSSLTCFSPKCSFEFPALKMVRVKKIPKMEKFSDGSQSTPQLKAINVTFIGKCWWGDLNATIEKLHTKNGKNRNNSSKTGSGPNYFANKAQPDQSLLYAKS
ncbi:hypothetical protein ACB092_08G013900 [Castanea dentata]